MISNRFLLGLINTKGLGRKSVFKLLHALLIPYDISENEFTDAVLSIGKMKKIPRFPDLSRTDLINGIETADRVLEKSQREGIKTTGYWDSDFPEELKTIEDPPLAVFSKGDFSILNRKIGIAVIGTREPDDNGIKTGRYVGKYFGEKGFNIVSGLANGCDASAHEGALKGNGSTTAILAHGLHMIYPKENKLLASRILEGNGLLISEYQHGTAANRNFFVERDRLQAGVSRATIVIQTGIKGGTMHAVNATLKSNKPLAAIQYKSEQFFEKTEGNRELIFGKKAFALTSENMGLFSELVMNGQRNETDESAAF